jgi:hypothetical protein
MKIFLNPLYGRFEIKQNNYATINPIAPAVWIEVTKNCDPSIAVGDFVYVDPINVDFVIKNIDNTPDYPTIGVVIAKPSTTTCRVALYGEIAMFTGLTQADYVFLSTTGTATSVPPTTDYVQILGYATTPTKMILNPQILRARRAS